MNGKTLVKRINENLLFPLIRDFESNDLSEKKSSLSLDSENIKIYRRKIYDKQSAKKESIVGYKFLDDADYTVGFDIKLTGESNIKTLAKFILFGLSEDIEYTLDNSKYVYKIIDVKLYFSSTNFNINPDKTNDTSTTMTIVVCFKRDLK